MGNIRDKYKVYPNELNKKEEKKIDIDSPSFAEDILLYTELMGLEIRREENDDEER